MNRKVYTDPEAFIDDAELEAEEGLVGPAQSAPVVLAEVQLVQKRSDIRQFRHGHWKRRPKHYSILFPGLRIWIRIRDFFSFWIRIRENNLRSDPDSGKHFPDPQLCLIHSKPNQKHSISVTFKFSVYLRVTKRL